MLNRLKQNPLGSAGLLGCLLFGALGVVEIWMEGPGQLDVNSPVGGLITALAAMTTRAPSLTSAGSDRAVLIFWLFFLVHLLTPIWFAWLWWRRCSPSLRRSAAADARLLELQLALGLATLSPLLFLVAAEFAFLLPLRAALKWLAAQLVLVAGTHIYYLFFSGLALSIRALKLGLIYLGFTLLIYVIVFAGAWAVRRERRARLDLAASHARLLGTQILLGDTVRASERSRIARDLHDIIGHHLTALNLHLDLTLRQLAPAAPPALQTSRELANALLAEVRAVVSAERNERQIDLRQALAALCAGIPQPAIRLSFEDGLEIGSPLLAHTLFCCVQEAISNAVRHAGATELTIALRRDGAQVQVLIRDDGRGAAGSAEGNGLRGMRERLDDIGGTLALDAASGRGYGLAISLPLAGAAL